MRNFKELEVWKLGMDIVKDIYRIVSKLPIDERFGLKSQLTRAAVSIPSNIAEGSAKDSEKEFRLYLERALGSSFEIETQLLIAMELELISADETRELISKIVLAQKKLGSFISSVKRRIPST
jgi:four helix bundle protein